MEGFVREEEPALEPTNRAVEGKDVSLVSRREGNTAWNSVLYIREHVVEVQKKLDAFINSKNDRLYVTGPPGCGKTCFLYLWARRLSVLEKKRVLIIQFREKETNYIWIREAGGALWRMKKSIDAEDLRQVVKNVLNKNEEGTPFDLCIHDGVLDKLALCSSMLSTLNNAVTNKVIGKVVHVTSLAFKLSTGGQNLDKKHGTISQISIDSWCEEDYQKAVSCEAFMNKLSQSGECIFDQDRSFLTDEAVDDDAPDEATEEEQGDATMEEVVEEEQGDSTMDDAANVTGDTSWLLEVVKAKYFLAGGSPRFMFQFEMGELREQLDKRLESVAQADWMSFSQQSVSSCTPSAVNTLMQQFEGRCTPISEYVLFRAYEKCKSDLVRSVRAVANASGNPTLKGWAFELEQLDLIRLSFTSDEKHPEYATNSNGLSFRPTSEAKFDEADVTGDVQDSTVIWCLKWNQGCFDVAFYQDETLATLQFTVSETHTLKLQFVRKLWEALKRRGLDLRKVVHIGVRETDWTNFRFKQAEGVGRQVLEQEAEFVIDVYRSPPILKTPKGRFSCDDPGVLLSNENVWKVGNKQRRRNQPS